MTDFQNGSSSRVLRASGRWGVNVFRFFFLLKPAIVGDLLQKSGSALGPQALGCWGGRLRAELAFYSLLRNGSFMFVPKRVLNYYFGKRL